MNSPMRLINNSEMTEICSKVDSHTGCIFCNLSEFSLSDFDAISLAGFYPKGAKLFAEGQQTKGVFILCSGRAKLSVGSNNGRSLMRIAEPQEILGLSATLSGRPYEESAEILESGQVNFIRRDFFLNFLSNRADASLRVAQHLSSVYAAVHEQMRAMALSDSVAEKLARLLLHWYNKSGSNTEYNIHLKLSLTHGDIAQMIGVSRETVTRLLGEWRNKGIIHLKGSNLLIKDAAALERFVNS